MSSNNFMFSESFFESPKDKKSRESNESKKEPVETTCSNNVICNYVRNSIRSFVGHFSSLDDCIDECQVAVIQKNKIKLVRFYTIYVMISNFIFQLKNFKMIVDPEYTSERLC